MFLLVWQPKPIMNELPAYLTHFPRIFVLEEKMVAVGVDMFTRLLKLVVNRQAECVAHFPVQPLFNLNINSK